MNLATPYLRAEAELRGGGGTAWSQCGGAFTTQGPETGRDGLLFGAGFAVLWSERLPTYLYCDGEIGCPNFGSHSIAGGDLFSF